MFTALRCTPYYIIGSANVIETKKGQYGTGAAAEDIQMFVRRDKVCRGRTEDMRSYASVAVALSTDHGFPFWRRADGFSRVGL